MAKMINLFKVFMPPQVDAAVLATLHSGYITQGSKVDEFEQELGTKLGTRKVLTVNSGTSALTLALRLADVGPGDEVISTPMTCVATNVPIATAGARIVWADVDPDTGLIDPADVMRKKTAKTKAIVAVDWGGLPCDYDTLRIVADGIPVLSDAAHSFGATYKNRRVGLVTDFTAFSFQAIKTITSIDGGALVCTSNTDYERGRLLRWFGVDRTTDHKFRGEQDVVEAGYKFHMNDVNATVGLETLRLVATPLSAQREGATMYWGMLDNYYQLPWVDYPAVSASWLMTVLLPDGNARDNFVERMTDHGIEVSQVHWRNDHHTAFHAFAGDPLPGLDEFADRMVCVPNHYALTNDDRLYIIDKMNEFADGQ